MQKSKNKLALLLVTASFIVLIATMVATSAFLTDANTLSNDFVVGSNETHIEEQFDPPSVVNEGDVIDKVVTVKNDGSKSYVRVLVQNSMSEVDFDCDFNTQDWTLDSDEYWYYNKVLGEGESTTPLFTKVTVKKVPTAAEMDGATNIQADVICYSESVQADGHNSAKEAFAAIKAK